MTSESRHALNAVCPYFTMFPLEFPYRILGPSPKRASVLDPFCGRGTTNYAARSLKVASYGIDSSPIAVAIARAKLAQASEDEVLELMLVMLEDDETITVPIGAFWERAYHPETLIQLCRLRKGLFNRRSDAANLLRGVVLGCLHGPQSKHPESAGYFSNQMPRTFASKPDYSVRYWQKHRLQPRNVDVRLPIRRKLGRIFEDKIPVPREMGAIRRGDSTKAASYAHVPDRLSHVITSPPYYGLVTYVEDQWLRHWFLGGPDSIEYGNRVQLSHRSPEEFSRTLARVWDHCGDHLATSGIMAVRFGSIRSRDKDPKAILRQSLRLSKHHWRITSERDVGTAAAGKRQADLMGTISAPTNEYDFRIRPG